MPQSVGAAEVHNRIQVRTDAVAVHRQHQIVVPVAIQVTHRAGQRAIGRQLDPFAVTQRVGVQISGHVLGIILTVAYDQVEPTVAVEIVLMDALQHAGTRDIQVLAAVAEGAGAKFLESAASAIRRIVHRRLARLGRSRAEENQD